MYCIKCGQDNLETAKFCRKCGDEMGGQQSAVSTRQAAAGGGPFIVPGEPEEETRVAVRESGEAARSPMSNVQSPIDGVETEATEAEIFSISPTLMFVKGGYVLAALGALLLVAVFSAFTEISAWVAVLIGLLLFLVPGFYHFKQKLVRYTLTDSKLEIDEGFISRSTRSVPIRRIQDVTVSSGVVQRLLGFGDLMIDNASDEGGKVVLKNINTPKQYADVLLRQMRRLDG